MPLRSRSLREGAGLTSGRPGPPGVAPVEAGLSRELDRLPARLADPCRRVAAAGGKRLRARLSLAAAAAVGGPGIDGDGVRRPVDAAVAVELLHLATLVHDDLLDEAQTRRGVPTINAREGATTAVLAGDVLIGAAGRLAAGVGAEAGALLQETLVDLCAGQSLEEECRYDPTVPVETVLTVADKKTGSLLDAACRLGALAAGEAAGRLVPALGAYGRSFGVCLQLLDDILDLVSSEPLYGKPTGVDFAAGTVTVPAVRALATDGELRGLLRPGLTAGERRRALALLRCAGGVSDAVACAEDCARSAERLLGSPDLGGGRSLLDHLAELPRRYVDAQLDLVLPEYRHLLAPPAARSA